MVGVRYVWQDESLDQRDYVMEVKVVSQLKKLINRIFNQLVNEKHDLRAHGVGTGVCHGAFAGVICGETQVIHAIRG